MVGFKQKIRLTNPWTQNLVSGVVLFLTVGIYLAITGLGAGGGKPSSIKVATTTNAVLYVLFTVVGFFGGSIMNTIGPRLTLAIGAFGYPFYASSLWYYDVRGQEWYPLLGGAVLGVSAALLWTVSGFMQFAYAEEADKGVYIAWQLFLLNVGCAVGALVAFGININDTSSGGVPGSVYIAFIVIMFSAILLALLCVVPPEKVVREDGTHLAEFAATDFKTEFIGCAKLLTDWRILLLIAPMFATEMSLALVPTLSALAFNLRTRSLNNVIFWIVQIPATFLYGSILDNKRYSRRVRGIMALSVAFLIILVAWALVIVVQIKHGLYRGVAIDPWDWTSEPFGEFCALMVLFGIAYTINQMAVMWILSSFSNEPRLLARYGGFFKAMLSAGLCVAFGLEAGSVPYMAQTIIQLVLMVGSFPIMFYLVWKCVSDTNYFSESAVIPPSNIVIGVQPNEEQVESIPKESKDAKEAKEYGYPVSDSR